MARRQWRGGRSWSVFAKPRAGVVQSVWHIPESSKGVAIAPRPRPSQSVWACQPAAWRISLHLLEKMSEMAAVQFLGLGQSGKQHSAISRKRHPNAQKLPPKHPQTMHDPCTNHARFAHFLVRKPASTKVNSVGIVDAWAMVNPYSALQQLDLPSISSR